MADITTDVYRQKIAKAVGGAGTVPAITTVVLGTGGQNSDETPKVPAGSVAGLYNQVLSKAAPAPTYPTATSVQFQITVNPADLPANTKINEIGFKASDGTFAGMSTFYAKATDGSTTMTFTGTLQL